MTLSNNNEEKYFVITTSHGTETYKCHVCKKINSDSNQLFLVNEYCADQITNSYLPIFTQLQNIKNFKNFVELFTKDSKVYVVFHYINSSLLISKIKNEKPSVEERLSLLEAFCIALMKIDMLPLPIKYELLHSDNVNINSNGEIYFNYSLQLYKKSNYVTNLDFTNKISDMVKVVFQDTKIPSCVQSLIKKLDDGSLSKLSNIYITIQNLKEEYPKEQQNKELQNLALKRKNKRLIACITAILILIGVPTTYYYLVKSKTIPAINLLEQNSPSRTIERIGTVEIKNY